MIRDERASFCSGSRGKLPPLHIEARRRRGPAGRTFVDAELIVKSPRASTDWLPTMRWLLLPLLACATRPPKRAFFVLKRGHSGSTWLSSLILNLPLTYFVDELVSASANFDQKTLRGIFEQGLRAPTTRDWRKTTGDSNVETCWKDAKCQLNAIGFSFSPLTGPKHNKVRPGIAGILQGCIAKTHAKPILFLKTNVVKLSRAVNGDKTALRTAGHSRQLLRNRKPHEGNWTVSTFVRSVNDAILRNNDLLDIRHKVHAEWLVVYYEQLQTETAEVMDSIRRALVIPRVDKHVLARAPAKKTTSDDLRDVVYNFAELEEALQGRYASPCVLKMLREVRPTVHPVCGELK